MGCKGELIWLSEQLGERWGLRCSDAGALVLLVGHANLACASFSSRPPRVAGNLANISVGGLAALVRWVYALRTQPPTLWASLPFGVRPCNTPIGHLGVPMPGFVGTFVKPKSAAFWEPNPGRLEPENEPTHDEVSSNLRGIPSWPDPSRKKEQKDWPLKVQELIVGSSFRPGSFENFL